MSERQYVLLQFLPFNATQVEQLEFLLTQQFHKPVWSLKGDEREQVLKCGKNYIKLTEMALYSLQKSPEDLKSQMDV